MNKIGIFLLLIVSFSFSSCLDFTDEAKQGMQDKLLGTWQLTSRLYLGGSVTPSNKETLEFLGDYTYVYEINDIPQLPGEYYITYDYIEINGYTSTFLKFTNKEMVFHLKNGDTTCFYEKIN
jgi:hypothetical protein